MTHRLHVFIVSSVRPSLNELAPSVASRIREALRCLWKSSSAMTKDMLPCDLKADEPGMVVAVRFPQA